MLTARRCFRAQFDLIQVIGRTGTELWGMALSSEGGRVAVGGHDRAIRVYSRTEQQVGGTVYARCRRPITSRLSFTFLLVIVSVISSGGAGGRKREGAGAGT